MLATLCCLVALQSDLKAQFTHPPDSTRPGVYWYFMEGNMSKAGIKADLEAMKRAGIGAAIFFEVNIGVPKGPVKYMSPEWLDLVGYAIKEADRLGMRIDMATGPGWCGTGGPWIKPDEAMQHLVSAEISVQGPATFSGKLPQPKPRTPFFGMGSLTPELAKQWASFYRDEVVLACPTPSGGAKIQDLDEKSLVYRPSFSSMAGTKAFLSEQEDTVPSGATIPSGKVIDVTKYMTSDGTLNWQVPSGKWTILRFGRTLTGQTTRPAPDAGLGFESDKFDRAGITDHLHRYLDPILKAAGPRTPGRGLVDLHFDSWEMGSQNWSPRFRTEFRRHCGYDPTPFLPVMAGKVVDSVEISERFLWDLRETAQSLVLANHMGVLRERGKQDGLSLSIEPYDLNPASDLSLGGAADVPMGEFWSKGYGYNTEYSVIEAVSAGHTNGRPVIGAESFTADDRDRWFQHPNSMKAQTDWAFSAGLNKLYFHRYQHQPSLTDLPGMTMAIYGVHWERTETWWDLVKPYHEYIARCQEMLRQGLPVADILYLVPEGAPNVFVAPLGATVGMLPDRRGYNFDACSPERLIQAAKVKDGRIVFPDGMSYRLLVLPKVQTMTPRLLQKVASLLQDGASIQGTLPTHSPSLRGYPRCDAEVRLLSTALGLANTMSRDGHLTIDSPSDDPLTLLDKSHWIWTDEGDARVAVPLAERTFHKRFSIDRSIAGMTATAAFLGDNSFRIKVNGYEIIRGKDFDHFEISDTAGYLHRGENEIEAFVTNEGEKPNPAGLLGNLEIRFEDGSRQSIGTDETWSSVGHGVKDLGTYDIAPWNLGPGLVTSNSLYPPYATTARLLRDTLHVLPDVESKDRLRYAHRRLKDQDIYFLANRSDDVFEGTVELRADQGTPQWWDPMTGSTRPLPLFSRKAGVTSIPLRLEGLQSGFVVFSPTSGPEKGLNFTKPVLAETLTRAWTVTFDPQRGGPASVEFDHLTDWSTRPEGAIRYYSGKATYTKTFDTSVTGAAVLSLGNVANIASVTLNGKDLGVAWCAPWRLDIPAGLLKPTGNRLEIQVANLWPNRLIGDSKLPVGERMTKTTWNPFNPDSPLLPSGLLGPVQILR